MIKKRSLIPRLCAKCLLAAALCLSGNLQAEEQRLPFVSRVLQQICSECHNRETSEGGLDLSSLPWNLGDRGNRRHWVRIHDRVERGEMPPAGGDFPKASRARFAAELGKALHAADLADVVQSGRGPMRRLNRDEYQQNLRDILVLPALDIRDILPADRESHHFNKTTETLDISRVQLAAYLDAAEAALRQAIASGIEPPPVQKYQARGAALFTGKLTFGNREAMFFAKDSKAVSDQQLDKSPNDPQLEMALFRSAHWPYYGYPRGFVARLPGEYRVRFSARAVVQLPGFQLRAAAGPVPMTFRARKPSGPDVSGDVRATGGLMDIKPEPADYETTVRLRAAETFEYSLLGLPVPLARNVDNGPPTYRYPPFPQAGQPGVAFRSLEIEGPLPPPNWPPQSHRVLFDALPIRPSPDGRLPVEVISDQPQRDVRRLLRRFADRAARTPVPKEELNKFERLAFGQLQRGASFTEAMLAGYTAFLSSGHMLYLHEPTGEQDHFAIASRLSHFLAGTRPDAALMNHARKQQLRDATVLRLETDRLIGGNGFKRFVENFTDYWLDLRHVHRDQPDIRLYPEYRFDAYLVESMARETRHFFAHMIRENRPVRELIKADFVFANDRLAQHYRLAPLQGSALRKVTLPEGSPYGGLLTQAAILKVTANGTATSPVVRGAWIMDRLLGQPPPPPPASVPAVEPDIRGAKTIRQLLALHTKSESCANCHARFDPIGLALENYDVLGGWRTRYRSMNEGQVVSGIDRAGHDFSYHLASPVDPTGKLKDGRDFRDIHQLKRLVSTDSRQLARNLLQQFALYATGTPVRYSDRAEIEQMLNACQADYRVGDLLRAMIHSKLFLGRAGCQPSMTNETP